MIMGIRRRESAGGDPQEGIRSRESAGGKNSATGRHTAFLIVIVPELGRLCMPNNIVLDTVMRSCYEYNRMGRLWGGYGEVMYAE